MKEQIMETIDNIITNATNEWLNILYKYKHFIKDFKKAIRYIKAGFYNSIRSL